MMPYSLAVKAMAGLMALMGACGPDITVVKNCAGHVVDKVLNSNDYELPGGKGDGAGSGVFERFYCAVTVEPAAPGSLGSFYVVQDPKARTNPWGWWVACIINLPPDAHLPTAKSTGASNALGQEPVMFCHDATVPIAIIAQGTCRYDNPDAANRAVFDRGFVAVAR